MTRAVYPGSFDPVHNGHVDITNRASQVFDSLVVGVYEAPPKELLFATEERVDLFRKSVAHLPNVEVASFSGLVVSFARHVEAGFVVRGLRAGLDFETEFEMAHMWRTLASDVDVVCMMSALEYQFVNSSRIKEVVQLGADVHGLVPEHVASALSARMKPR